MLFIPLQEQSSMRKSQGVAPRSMQISPRSPVPIKHMIRVLEVYLRAIELDQARAKNKICISS